MLKSYLWQKGRSGSRTRESYFNIFSNSSWVAVAAAYLLYFKKPGTQSYHCPTVHFTIFEHRNPPIGEFYRKKRRSTDFECQVLRNVRLRRTVTVSPAKPLLISTSFLLLVASLPSPIVKWQWQHQHYRGEGLVKNSQPAKKFYISVFLFYSYHTFYLTPNNCAGVIFSLLLALYVRVCLRINKLLAIQREDIAKARGKKRKLWHAGEESSKYYIWWENLSPNLWPTANNAKAHFRVWKVNYQLAFIF